MSERLDRIEANLENLTVALGGLVQLAESNHRSIGSLATLAESNQRAIAALVVSVDRFVDSSNAYLEDSKARMAQMEANLDALLKAITREHSNGKTGAK